MNEIITSQQAKNDLKDIFLYTLDEWGDKQAVEYLLQIDAGIQGLLGNPKLGISRETLRSGYRTVQVNHHVVYYRLDEGEILIIRVLHERMLPSKHL